MRASYFPFTEPSVEVDIRCTLCHGSGCRVCTWTGWLELLGGGVVHPTVLRNGGYDPEKVSGIAWGMGVERQLLLRHEIHDIRVSTRTISASCSSSLDVQLGISWSSLTRVRLLPGTPSTGPLRQVQDGGATAIHAMYHASSVGVC
jgi:hypothetical protein